MPSFLRKKAGKKVGKEPFNKGFVLLIIICRDPRGKFFAKLSAKESGEESRLRTNKTMCGRGGACSSRAKQTNLLKK